MSHGRPPRRVRFVTTPHTMSLVVRKVTRLTAHELGLVLGPIESSLTALREGVASELEWSLLASAVEIALAVEDKGVVRGMRGHIEAAERALQGIKLRAMATGEWLPTALYYQELDDVTAAVELHRFQLEQLSSAEARKALDLAKGRVRAAGGRVIEARRAEGIAQ
jgi:hypothetical protein